MDNNETFIHVGFEPISLFYTLNNSGRKVSPPPKSVFHSCIWPSAGIAIATELLYVLGNNFLPITYYLLNEN